MSKFAIWRHQKICLLSKEERKELKPKEKVKCQTCGKTIADIRKLRRHIRFIHKQEKLFGCNHCGHQDYRKDNMKTHIKNNHSGMDINASIIALTDANV